MPGTFILGTGHHVPGDPVTNQDLARVLDTNDAWIQKRTGIQQRHFAPHGVGASDLGVEAAKLAIEDAGLKVADIDYVVFASMTPDHPIPGPGGLLAAKLGAEGVPALDIRQQCAATPYALQVADGLLHSGAARTVLYVAAEAHAGLMPWKRWDLLYGAPGEVDREEYERATRHRGIAVVFGDGAGAMVLRRRDEPGRGLLGTQLVSEGQSWDYLCVRGGSLLERPAWTHEMLDREEDVPVMKGPELLKKAVRELPPVVRQLCDRQGVSLEEIDWCIAHQANDRINEAVRNALKLPPERMPSNIDRYGNTSGATIPILYDELRRAGKLREGHLVCFVALGAGLHWGASLMRL